MPRHTNIKKKGFIPIPQEQDRTGWKIIVIASDETEYDITDDLDGSFRLERIATDGLSNFTFILDNTEGKYKDKFAVGNKVNFYYDFKDFDNQDTLRFRGYIDNVFNEVHGGSFTILIEGRDAPKSSTNEHFGDTDITIKFVSVNILDCWLGTIGTADDEGNCVANYEEIYTQEGIKKIGELKEGDFVLSYDFKIQKYVYKKIKKIWERGRKEIKRVYLRNGDYIDVTSEHPFLVRTNQVGRGKYIKQNLKDIDLSRWWKRRLPISKKIPYFIKDIEWLNEDLCFIIGHFIAEGSIDSTHVRTSGYDVTEQIIPKLETNNIPFSEGHNGKGVPIVTFLESDFKNFLKKFKKNSFDIHIPESIFHLPRKKLQSLLNGIYLGDGHYGNYLDERGYKASKQECYTSVSKQLIKDIQRIYLQLGKPIYLETRKYKDKTCLGKLYSGIIYGLSYNPNSFFSKDYGWNQLSETTISYIEDKGIVNVRDFEVEDTHIFIFRNGLLSHNCQDGVLYNSGLIMKIYDILDKTWKDYKDLTDTQKDTLKAQTGYTSVHSDTHVEKKRLTISKILADEGNYDFRIFYNSSEDKSYLYIHPNGVIINSAESVVLGQNFIDLGRFGKDTLTEANRVKEKGFSDGEILLMRTKQDTIRQSAVWIKDKVETSSSIKTTDELDAKATARLNQFKDVGKSGTLITCGLPTLQPAEKFRLILPYVINEEIISKSFTITGGGGIGLEFIHNLLTRESTMQGLFKDRIKENEAVVPSDNENGHRNVFLFDFSDPSDYILDSAQIVNEVLSIVDGGSEGFCTTINKIADNNVTEVELRVKGNQLLKCTYKVRNTGNESDWVSIAPNTSITLSTTGKNIHLEIRLRQSSTGSNPEFDKAELLYTEE